MPLSYMLAIIACLVILLVVLRLKGANSKSTAK